MAVKKRSNLPPEVVREMERYLDDYFRRYQEGLRKRLFKPEHDDNLSIPQMRALLKRRFPLGCKYRPYD